MESTVMKPAPAQHNHFELRLKQWVSSPADDPARPSQSELILAAEIWIDGVLLDEPHTVSVGDVLRSFAKPGVRSCSSGWHFVFTCGCGNACCANIDEGVGVVHTDDAVDWVFRRPQANPFGIDVLGFKQWCETATWHCYSFDRHQATRELIRFLDETWRVINTSTIEVAEKEHILFWFNDDPRYGMRYRSDEAWFAQGRIGDG